MALKYHCTNDACSHPGSSRYEITFEAETILDANNIAASYCPFCKQEMMPDLAPGIINHKAYIKSKILSNSSR